MSTNNAYGKEKVPAGKPEPAKGMLGVMIPGMGAVATTLIAGVEAVSLCRDSILAAPLALDLILFLDLAARTPGLRALAFRSG